MYRSALIAIVGIFLLLGAACGGGGDSNDSPDRSDKAEATDTAESSKSDKTKATKDTDEKDETDDPPASQNEPTIEGLYAAMLGVDDLDDVLGGGSWWPAFPEFNLGFDPTPSGTEGEQFWVAQTFQSVGGDTTEMVQATLILFEDEDAAENGLEDISSDNDGGSDTVRGPAVGDDSRYFTRESDPEETGLPPLETTLRFRLGPVVGRVTFLSEEEFGAPRDMAALFESIEGDIEAFIDGTLEPATLPGWAKDLLPSDDAAEGAGTGTVLGTATIPIESWALADDSGDPLAVRDLLDELGAKTLALRRYGLDDEPNLAIEATLFRLGDEDAAATWAGGFVDGITGDAALDPGETGRVSAYTSYDGTFYELQFAKGTIVGDVVCFAPFGETIDTCEEPVRALAEAWYAELPE